MSEEEAQETSICHEGAAGDDNIHGAIATPVTDHSRLPPFQQAKPPVGADTEDPCGDDDDDDDDDGAAQQSKGGARTSATATTAPPPAAPATTSRQFLRDEPFVGAKLLPSKLLRPTLTCRINSSGSVKKSQPVDPRSVKRLRPAKQHRAGAVPARLPLVSPSYRVQELSASTAALASSSQSIMALKGHGTRKSASKGDNASLSHSVHISHSQVDSSGGANMHGGLSSVHRQITSVIDDPLQMVTVSVVPRPPSTAETATGDMAGVVPDPPSNIAETEEDAETALPSEAATVLSAHCTLAVEDAAENSGRTTNGRGGGIVYGNNHHNDERPNDRLRTEKANPEGRQNEPTATERSYEERKQLRVYLLYCALAILVVVVLGILVAFVVVRGLTVDREEVAKSTTATPRASVLTSPPGMAPTVHVVADDTAPNDRISPDDESVAPPHGDPSGQERPFPCAHGWYYYTYHSNADRMRHIGSLDVLTTDDTALAGGYISTPDCFLRDVTFDRVTGAAYGQCQYSSFRTLVTVDLSSGNTTALAAYPSTDYSGLAYNPVDGHLYTTVAGFSGSSLVKIEKNWTFTNVGNSSLGTALRGFAIDSNGNAFGTDREGRFYSVNLKAGTSVVINWLPFESQNIAFRGDDDALLYGIGMRDPAPLFVVDVVPVAGDPTITRVGSTYAAVTIGGDFCPLR